MALLFPKAKTIVAAAAAFVACAASADETALTVYAGANARASAGMHADGIGQPGGFAVITRSRTVRLNAGEPRFRIDDAPATLEPASVRLEAIDGGEPLAVLEQTFTPTSASADALLRANIDRRVRVDVPADAGAAAIEGILRHAGPDALVVETHYGAVHIVRDYSRLALPDQAVPLNSRPSLQWTLSVDTTAERRLRISYHAEHLAWWADYNLLVEDTDNECRLALSAWVTLANASGADYRDASLKLVAGDVRRQSAGAPAPGTMMMRAVAEDAVETFETGTLGEHHVYRLPRRITLPDQSLRQIELFPTETALACERRYLMHSDPGYRAMHGEPFLERSMGGEHAQRAVTAELLFSGADRTPLERALPAGRVRVHTPDSDGALEFVGEDHIGHTPAGEAVRVQLGNAFDLRGERRQMDFRLDRAARIMEEDIELRIRNARATTAHVDVEETLYRWAEWDIVNSSHEWSRLDAWRARIPVEVAGKGETVIRYTARYSW